MVSVRGNARASREWLRRGRCTPASSSFSLRWAWWSSSISPRWSSSSLGGQTGLSITSFSRKGRGAHLPLQQRRWSEAVEATRARRPLRGGLVAADPSQAPPGMTAARGTATFTQTFSSLSLLLRPCPAAVALAKAWHLG